MLAGAPVTAVFVQFAVVRSQLPLPPPQTRVAGANATVGETFSQTSRFLDLVASSAKAEADAARRFTNWVHPYGYQDREARPIELEAFYRFHEKTPASGEWVVSYVEAIRRFPAGPFDNNCGLITWVRGWVIQREGKKADMHLTATVTYCDREGVAFMQPLGHLTIDGEAYWVYQMSSWRDEIYTVARMHPDEVRPVMNVFGGGCPKDAVR